MLFIILLNDQETVNQTTVDSTQLDIDIHEGLEITTCKTSKKTVEMDELIDTPLP